jgi:hypothetical protein
MDNERSITVCVIMDDELASYTSSELIRFMTQHMSTSVSILRRGLNGSNVIRTLSALEANIGLNSSKKMAFDELPNFNWRAYGSTVIFVFYSNLFNNKRVYVFPGGDPDQFNADELVGQVGGFTLFFSPKFPVGSMNLETDSRIAEHLMMRDVHKS